MINVLGLILLLFAAKYVSHDPRNQKFDSQKSIQYLSIKYRYQFCSTCITHPQLLATGCHSRLGPVQDSSLYQAILIIKNEINALAWLNAGCQSC